MNQKMIRMEIDGRPVEVPAGTTILTAAETIGVEIPTLCHLKDLSPFGACRLCVVEAVSGFGARLVTSCSEPCAEGLRVYTASPRVVASRRFVLDLLLSQHLQSCFSCERNGECKDRQISFCNYDKNCFTCPGLEDCRLRKHCIEYGLDRSGYAGRAEEKSVDGAGAGLVYNPNLCILCRRCQRTCESLPGRDIIAVLGRGLDTVLDMPFGKSAYAELCAACGKCAEACPTGALSAKA